ncbi:MAG: hypothetical protein Fur0018_07050 [Anaerolineales bacterium]
MWGLLLHALLHVLMAFLLVQDAGRFWRLWVILGVAHFLTDWYKLRLTFRPAWLGFLLDQGVHITVLGLLAWAQPGLHSVLPVFWLRVLLVYAILPSGLMFGWVYASGKEKNEVDIWHWMRQTFVRYSQISGYVLVLAVLYLVYTMR